MPELRRASTGSKRAADADLDRLGRRVRGDTGDFLVVPKGDRAYFEGTPIPIIGLNFARGAQGLLLPADAVRPPQPIDLIKTYITYSEIVGVAPSATYVGRALQRVARDPFVIECAQVLGAYESLQASRRELDERLAKAWFKGKALSEVLARIQSGSTLVAPQTLLLLIQWALLLSPEIPPADASPVNLGAVVVALQDGLGVSRDERNEPTEENPNVFTGETGSALFREVVSSADFYANQDLGTTLAHHHERWVRLSNDLDVRPDAVDLAAAFYEATGVTKDDFTAVGLAIWAHCETHSRYRIPSRTLDSFKLPSETVDRVLDLFSANPERMIAEMSQLNQRFLTEWSFGVLGRFPILRVENGDLVVLSKNLLVERLFGWLPIFDVVEGLKLAGRKSEAKRADLWLRALCEADANESLRAVASASRFYDSTAIQAAFGTDHPNADAAIEYPDAWIGVEIGTHQLKRDTVVAGDPEALESDLRHAIDDKAKQLDSTLRDLMENETALTGREPVVRRRYVAVLVLTEGFPVNPMTMTAIRQRLAGAGLLTDPRMGALHVLDQEELDIVEALTEQTGVTFLELLEKHEQSSLRDMSLKDWLLTDRTRGATIVSNRPKRLEAARDAIWRVAVGRLNEANASAEAEVTRDLPGPTK